MLTGSVRKETVAVSDTIRISVQNRHSRILLRDLLHNKTREMHRDPRVLEAEAQVGKWLDCRARITSKELAPLHSVKKKAFSRMLVLQVRKWMQILEISALTHTARLTNSPARSKKKNGDKIAVAILKSTRQLGCVFQDMEPPKSSSILRKSSNILKPIRCVPFTDSRVTSRQHSRPKTIAWNNLPR